eukprot:6589698-Prymnesium_polylepis.1
MRRAERRLAPLERAAEGRLRVRVPAHVPVQIAEAVHARQRVGMRRAERRLAPLERAAVERLRVRVPAH